MTALRKDQDLKGNKKDDKALKRGKARADRIEYIADHIDTGKLGYKLAVAQHDKPNAELENVILGYIVSEEPGAAKAMD